MRTSPIGRRYAKALLDLAEQQKITERVVSDLNGFVESWRASRDLRVVFQNPAISQFDRKKVLISLLDRMEVTSVVRAILLMLADRDRLHYIEEMVTAFEQLAEEKMGKVRAEVTTPALMSDGYYIELQKALEVATGKTVVILKKADPSLIAGVMTRVGDRVFDGSVRAKLMELKEQLLA